MTTFISYSRVNSDFAIRLAKDLKSSGHDVWLDQLNIPTGSRWDDELEKALIACTTFLIILSPASIKSQNVKDEIGYAIDSGDHILPVMIEPCDVPFRLRRFQFVNFTDKSYEESLKEITALLSNTSQLASAKDAGENPAQSTAQAPKSKAKGTTVAKMPFSMPALIGGGAAILVILIAVIAMLSGGGSSTTTPTDIPATPTEPATQVAANTPEPTNAPAEPTLGPQPFFTEEFNGDLSHWSSFVTTGDESRMNIHIKDSRMIFELNDPNSDLSVYYILNDFTYSDVQLETAASNRGVNENNISLICHYTDRGWYEFNIANSGVYTIYAYDSIGAIAKGYNELLTGGSLAIKSGQDTNTFIATCKGNKLSLSINGVAVRTITENQFRFNEGKIGLSVSSFQVLPVNVQFESIKISKP